MREIGRKRGREGEKKRKRKEKRRKKKRRRRWKRRRGGERDGKGRETESEHPCILFSLTPGVVLGPSLTLL